MNKLKIAILTTFHSWDNAYSLTSVVEAQLEALVKHGYNPILFVLTSFKDDEQVPRGVELRKVIPQIVLVDYSGRQEPHADFPQNVNKIYTALKENTQDIDIIIQHDLIFQGWFLPHAVAIHRLANESNIKWFHWMHSCPSDRPNTDYPHSLRFTLPRNSKLVYLNNKHLIRAAEMYGVFPKDVRIIYNSVDPRLLWNFHPLIKDLIERYDLLSADYIDIYPVSTTRMVDGKQIKVVIEVMASLKKLGKSIRLIVCNAHANDKREKQVVSEVISFANQKGLSSNEIIFTSMENIPDYELGVPREVVSQLFLLSNIFIFPSISENCSLVLLEAMLSKNLLVLNDNPWLPFREFAKENALYFDFGSAHSQVNHQNRDGFMLDVARIINSEMSTNKALNASTDLKKNFNYDIIFKQLENLFYEQ